MAEPIRVLALGSRRFRLLPVLIGIAGRRGLAAEGAPERIGGPEGPEQAGDRHPETLRVVIGVLAIFPFCFRRMVVGHLAGDQLWRSAAGSTCMALVSPV